MTVSIVISLFNKARHVGRAIDSVLAQTHQDWELIVVDDGSTDDSVRVVRQITDPRLRLIQQPNAGVSAARNRGIQEAAGELIAFLDADDEWLPCFLSTVMGLRSAYPEAGMFAAAYRFCEGGRTWCPGFVGCVEAPEGGLLDDYFRAGMGPAPVWTSAVMIPAHVLGEVGCFPVGISRGEDLHTWARIALRYRVAWSPIEGAVYHLSADNRLCSQTSTTDDVPMATVIEEFLASGRAPVSPRRTVEEYLASRRLAMALSRHLQGNRGCALRLLEKTANTRMHRGRRLLLRLLLFIPSSLLRHVLRMKADLQVRLGINPSASQANA